MNEKCPRCGNIVVGEIQRSAGSQFARTAIKKGGFKAAGAAIGSLFGGVGAIPGVLIGTGLDMIYGKEFSKVVDDGVDIFAEDMKYNFCCPNCGKTWQNKASTSQTYPQSNPSTSVRESKRVNGHLNVNVFPSNGPFTKSAQNKLYHALKEYSANRGGLSKYDYEEIKYLGYSIGLLPEDIYRVVSQCSWRDKRPSINELF